ncbi:MAG: ATPase [Bacteroidetes bacterium]|nr:MAG: ATPase [Bacteroidota bacterium]
MIVTNDISKSYAGTPALAGINFSVQKGELFGLIGPDGAGKSTLFKILTTLLRPATGMARVAGFDTVKDYRSIRKIIGYMPGRFSLYQDLSVLENLTFFATVFGTTMAANYHLIEEIYLQLEPFKNRRAGQLSGGMKQKLALCCALIHEPQVLFLDEPTTGVDAVSRNEFWIMLKRLKAHGITILVSTPYMDEANRCDRIALMQEGRIMQIDTPENMVTSYRKSLLAVRTNHFYALIQDLRNNPTVERVEPFGEYLHLTSQAEMDPQLIHDYLLARGHTAIEVKPVTASIEDVFLDLLEATPG